MNILIAILATCLVACVAIIIEQERLIRRQQKKLCEALEWVTPEAIVMEDWDE